MKKRLFLSAAILLGAMSAWSHDGDHSYNANGICTLDECTDPYQPATQAADGYYELANAKMHGTRSVFHQAIMMSLLHCVIFELLNITDRVEKLELNENEHMTQSDVLFKNFIELLAENEGRVRSVQEYAYMLNVSSKYLSSIVKQISGRTALDLIHETTTHSIVRQLKYTDKSIKEIATDMKFPSLSFFGKFVKSQLGVSPKKFRKGN